MKVNVIIINEKPTKDIYVFGDYIFIKKELVNGREDCGVSREGEDCTEST